MASLFTTPMRVVTIVIALTIARPAAADPVQLVPRAHRSPVAAVALSTAATLATAGLFYAATNPTANATAIYFSTAGVVLAPSAGEWYAGDYLNIGLGVRVVGAAMFLAGIRGNNCDPEPGITYSCWGNPVLVIAGMGVVASGAIYDIVTAGRAANRFNERHAADFQVVPAVMNAPSGPTVGLGIGGRF
jgi:hypothetical protein